MRCYRKILHITYKDHVNNEEVSAKIQQAIGPQEDLLTIVKRCRLQWYGQVSCSSGLAKTILQAQWNGEEDQADRGRGGKTTSGNGQARSSASVRGLWRTGKMEKTGCKIICGAPTTLVVKGLMMMMMMTLDHKLDSTIKQTYPLQSATDNRQYIRSHITVYNKTDIHYSQQKADITLDNKLDSTTKQTFIWSDITSLAIISQTYNKVCNKTDTLYDLQ